MRGNANGIAIHWNTVRGAAICGGSTFSLPSSAPPVDVPVIASVPTMSSAERLRGLSSRSTTAAPTMAMDSIIGPT